MLDLYHSHTLHRDHLNLLHLSLDRDHLYLLDLTNCLLNLTDTLLYNHQLLLLLLLRKDLIRYRSPNICSHSWLDLIILNCLISWDSTRSRIWIPIHIIGLIRIIISSPGARIIVVRRRGGRRSSAWSISLLVGHRKRNRY